MRRMASSRSVMIDVSIIWPIASTPAPPDVPSGTHAGKSSAIPLCMVKFAMLSPASRTGDAMSIPIRMSIGIVSFVPKDTIPIDIRIGMLIASPVLLAGLSIANFTIHNGMALLFPAWVPLGTSGGAGVEAMGQMMLTSIITLLLLAILLILPAIAGAAVYFVMQWPPLFAVASAGIAVGIACGLEGYLLIGALGGALDRQPIERSAKRTDEEIALKTARDTHGDARAGDRKERRPLHHEVDGGTGNRRQNEKYGEQQERDDRREHHLA